jgi:hypothetical protein
MCRPFSLFTLAKSMQQPCLAGLFPRFFYRIIKIEVNMLAIHGIYDGKVVVPKGKIPQGTREVIITFPDTEDDELPVAEKLTALRRITGIAAGNTMTLDEIKAARLAKQ